MSREHVARCRPLIRCLRLVKMVKGRRHINLQMLAFQLGVSTRTVRRDFQALDAAGVSVPKIWRERRDGDMAW